MLNALLIDDNSDEEGGGTQGEFHSPTYHDGRRSWEVGVH